MNIAILDDIHRAWEGTDGVRRLRERYTIVMIEHDMRFLFELADRISVIHWGQVIAEGTPEQLKENEWVRRSNLGRLQAT